MEIEEVRIIDPVPVYEKKPAKKPEIPWINFEGIIMGFFMFIVMVMR